MHVYLLKLGCWKCGVLQLLLSALRVTTDLSGLDKTSERFFKT